VGASLGLADDQRAADQLQALTGLEEPFSISRSYSARLQRRFRIADERLMTMPRYPSMSQRSMSTNGHANSARDAPR
jgi:hypothetical protein